MGPPVFAALSDEECAELRRELAQHGFTILRRALPPRELQHIMNTRVRPALDAYGIDVDEPLSWDKTSKLWAILDQRHAYRNVDGGQLQMQPTDGLNILTRAPRLNCALGDGAGAWTARGADLGRLHLRYPKGRFRSAYVPPSPTGGWHIERGAGHELHRVAILHVTTVSRGGGGVTVVRGSHLLVRPLRRFLWPHAPYIVGVIAAHILALLARWLMPWRVVEVCSAAGDAVLLDPYVVHSPSSNGSNEFRFTFQLRAEVTARYSPTERS
jgi:hypothetical protein